MITNGCKFNLLSRSIKRTHEIALIARKICMAMQCRYLQLNNCQTLFALVELNGKRNSNRPNELSKIKAHSLQ